MFRRSTPAHVEAPGSGLEDLDPGFAHERLTPRPPAPSVPSALGPLSVCFPGGLAAASLTPAQGFLGTRSPSAGLTDKQAHCPEPCGPNFAHRHPSRRLRAPAREKPSMGLWTPPRGPFTFYLQANFQRHTCPWAGQDTRLSVESTAFQTCSLQPALARSSPQEESALKLGVGGFAIV